MSFNFNIFKTESKGIEDWLVREMSTIRTGRATPAILDSVKVEAYGSFMPVNQLATVSVEDAQSMRISPWDATQLKAIEKAIQTSDLGVSVVADSNGLRVVFPSLTSERRTALLKIAKQKLEDAKVSLRAEREKTIKEIDQNKKDGNLSEDEQFRLKQDLQKMVDDVSKKLEEILAKKEKEIDQ